MNKDVAKKRIDEWVSDTSHSIHQEACKQVYVQLVPCDDEKEEEDLDGMYFHDTWLRGFGMDKMAASRMYREIAWRWTVAAAIAEDVDRGDCPVLVAVQVVTGRDDYLYIVEYLEGMLAQRIEDGYLPKD